MTQDPVQDHRCLLAGAPVRLAWRGPLHESAHRGAVLVYHGLGAAIAGQTRELHALAQAGLLAVGVDAVGHGERLRSDPSLARRLAAGGPWWQDAWLEVLQRTTAEVPGIVDALARDLGVREDGVGITGISMGAYVAFGAVPVEPRLRAAAPALGSPVWSADWPDSPHLKPEAFAPAALLIQNAGQDHNVPPAPARDFHRVLQPHYGACPERLAYVEYPDSGHFMSDPDWTALWSRVVAWFLAYLEGA